MYSTLVLWRFPRDSCTVCCSLSGSEFGLRLGEMTYEQEWKGGRDPQLDGDRFVYWCAIAGLVALSLLICGLKGL